MLRPKVGGGVSANSFDGRPSIVSHSISFDNRADAEAFAAKFPKSLHLRVTPILGSRKESYRDAGEGPMPDATAVQFHAALLSTKGNERNETGIARYHKYMEVLENEGVNLPWKSSTAYPTRADFETAIGPELAPTKAVEVEMPSKPVAPALHRVPMEFREAAMADVPKYIEDDKYYFQQKVDGIRGQLVLDPGKAPWFRSKSGDQLVNSTAAKVSTPLLKKRGAGSPEGSPAVTIDGEMLDGKWYVFDMTVAGSEGLPWETRMEMAESWVKSMNDAGIDQIVALPTARTPAEKKALFDAIKASGGEGVMMKRRDAAYKFGQRTDQILKAKITSTADVVVMERNVDGKENAVVGVYRNGKLERVANVPTQGKGNPQVGDVLEVEYLWAHPGTKLLTQARIKKARPDKDPLTATDTQFRYVNKDVLDLPDATPAAPGAAPAWESPEAVAELNEIRAGMAQMAAAWRRYDDFSTGKGAARNYSKWVHQSHASAAYKEYEALRAEWEPRNAAWTEKYQFDGWPADEVTPDAYWDSRPAVSVARVGALDAKTWNSIRDSYVVKDDQTTGHNASLRSDAPSSAAKTWRAKVSRMVRDSRTTSDAVVYRTAAFTPDFISQLVPGAVLTDPGFMSTGSSEAASFMYATTRVQQTAGSRAIYFHIRVPAGTPAADVMYGEVVLDYGNSMKILEAGMVGDRPTVVVQLMPKEAL